MRYGSDGRVSVVVPLPFGTAPPSLPCLGGDKVLPPLDCRQQRKSKDYTTKTTQGQYVRGHSAGGSGGRDLTQYLAICRLEARERA